MGLIEKKEEALGIQALLLFACHNLVRIQRNDRLI